MKRVSPSEWKRAKYGGAKFSKLISFMEEKKPMSKKLLKTKAMVRAVLLILHRRLRKAGTSEDWGILASVVSSLALKLFDGVLVYEVVKGLQAHHCPIV
jgi:hypothetical protein